jgi:AraC-like DNA-binding protein
MPTFYEAQIKPAVNFASLGTAQVHHSWGPRMIPDYQLFYIINGEAELQIGHQKLVIYQGECVYFGPGKIHQLTITKAAHFYSVHFEWYKASPEPVHPAYKIKEVDTIPDFAYEPDSVFLTNKTQIVLPSFISVYGLKFYFQKLVDEYLQEKPLFHNQLSATMTQLLTEILRYLLSTKQEAKHSKIHRAVQAIKNEPESDWSVSSLAHLCGYHPNYFAKLFYLEMGESPKKHVISERIKLAKQLLLQGDRLEDIAERLGYSSLHYFSHQFKRITGLSPSQYKQNKTF